MFSDRTTRTYVKDLNNIFVSILLHDPMCFSKEEPRSYNNKIMYLNCFILRIPSKDGKVSFKLF
jgi:hypothetical protein